MAVYDEYVWRLYSESPVFDVQLPKDLVWVDEFTWSPIQQTVETSLTGALIIQESVQQKGRPLTLQGKDDMAWIDRSVSDTLMQMRDTAGLVLSLQFVKWNGITYSTVLFEYNVMFRHYEPPVIELESVLGFDNFENTSWFKVRNLKFMEATSGASTPCSANATLTVSGVTGTFNIGETATGSISGTIGTVLSFSSPTLQLYVADGSFQSGEVISGSSGSATIV